MYRTLILLLLLTPLRLGMAVEKVLPPNSNLTQPISIQADSLTIDEKSGRSRYEGAVELQQGTLSLHADSLEIITQNRQIRSITTQGQPARLRQLTPQQLEAEAMTITYNAVEGVIELNGNARLNHEGDQFSGSAIRYTMRDNRVHASSDKQQKQRVQVILQPRSEP